MLDDAVAVGYVTELLENQICLDTFEYRKKELKAQLKNYIKHVGWVDTDLGRVKYYTETNVVTISRDEILSYIRQKYGDDVADDVDRNCTSVEERDGYVMVCLDRSKFPKKSIPEVNKSTFVPKSTRMSDEVEEYNLSLLKDM